MDLSGKRIAMLVNSAHGNGKTYQYIDDIDGANESLKEHHNVLEAVHTWHSLPLQLCAVLTPGQ